MSPILVRPVREQLEHDRVIRLLQAKYKRKFEVAINLGNEQSTPVGTGPSAWYPDLVLSSGRKLLGLVEVETSESVNNLEAMAQWAAFSRLRTPFHLYVPVSMIDVARRLCQGLEISVAEFWAYHQLGDQIRFTLVQRSAQASEGKPQAAAPVSRAATASARSTNGQTRARRAPASTGRRAAASTRGRKPVAKKASGAAKAGARRAGAGKARSRSVRATAKKSSSSARAQKRK